MRKIVAISLLFLFSFVGISIFSSIKPSAEAEDGHKIDTVLCAGEEIVIADKNGSSYKIVFSADAISEDNEIASALRLGILQKYGVNVSASSDATGAEVANEILIGNTNRALSTKLAGAVKDALPRDGLAWGYTYENGKLAFTASSGAALTRGKADFLALLKDDSFKVENGVTKVFSITKAEYDAELEADIQQKIDAVKQLNASIDSARFGKSTAVFDATGYGTPAAYPTKGQHPRVGLTEYMLDDIRLVMESPEMVAMMKLYNESLAFKTDGVLKTPGVNTALSYNWDSEVMRAIEARALAYALTGNELYAQEAIYAIKNCILTLVMTTDAQGDLFYAYGSVMRIAAEVYDWCYPVLTDKDRSDIIAGIENHIACKMTIGCPPVGMNGIQGHGTSSQLAVDYLAFSIAIYDERPDWYNLVGARLYNEWFPFINYYQESNYWNQGISTYADNKTSYQCRSAWYIMVMSGENPLPNMDKVIYGLLANTLPNGYYFPTGDGTPTSNGVGGGAFTIEKTLVVMQALFPNPSMQALVKEYLNDYTRTHISFNGYPYTETNVLIWRSQGSKETAGVDNKYDLIGTVSYASSPLGQMIARESWLDKDSPVVFMRIQELNVGNHEHEDSGTFQIYYKGLLTCNTGFYGSSDTYDAPYGSIHHKYYHQSTISTNGILVYNPAKSGDDPSIPARYYYSGGQIDSTGRDSFEDQINEPTAQKGSVTGYDYDYRSDGVTPKYAYIAGDITLAYPEDTVAAFERRMLSVFTADDSYPMFFFVFDNITSVNASFKKTFLLHTPNEPTVDGKVISSIQGDGKLVLTALWKDANIEAIGGEGKWFLVNGRPCSETEKSSRNWGRVEISVSGESYTAMVNTIYVTDKENDSYLESRIVWDDENAVVVNVAKTVVAFVKDYQRHSDEFSFVTTGGGLFDYYVSGLSAGTWRIKVDGVTVANIFSDEESGLINFSAPTGEVEIIPTDNVKPANSGVIKYVLNGAELPEGTQDFYIYDEEYLLPTPIHPDPDMYFAGWYSDAYYTQKIEEIPYGTRGTFKAYALFYCDYFEDFESNVVDVRAEYDKGSSVQNIGNMRYVTEGKTGAAFTTVSEGDNTYLLWEKGNFDLDPACSIKKSLAEFLGGRKTLTISVDLALNDGAPPIRSYMRLRGETSGHMVAVFWVQSDGRVTLGASTNVITTLTNELQTITVTLDLEGEMIYAYGEDGKTITSTELQRSDSIGDVTILDWARTNNNYIFDWYASKKGSGENAALRIDNVYVSGEVYKDALVPPGHVGINYENLNYGNMPANYPTSYVPGVGLDALPTPASDYFDFLGWYSDAELTVPVTHIDTESTEEITLYAKWELSSNIPSDKAVLVYNLNGGKYESTYTALTVGETVTLGTPVRANSVFAGWYTSPDYAPSTLINGEFTPTSGGAYAVYAKFITVILEDYENADFSTDGKELTVNGIKYIGTKANSLFKTETDGENTYLRWVMGTSDSSFSLRKSLPAMLADATMFTISFDIAIAPGSTPMRSYCNLRGVTSSNSATLFWIQSNGNITLGETKNTVITLTEEFQTVRITVDIPQRKLYAVDADGYIITECDLELKYPAGSTYTNFEEYISTCENYIFHWTATTKENNNPEMLLDNILFETGYSHDLPKRAGYISYSGVQNAVMPTDAPVRFDIQEGVDALPVPVSEYFDFIGWYFDAGFTKPATAIAAGTEGTVNLYAKWSLKSTLPEGMTVLNYQIYGGEYESLYSVIKSDETVTLGVPTLSGFEFLGWYTSPDFSEDAKISGNAYTPGVEGEVTIYARFVKTLLVDFNESDFRVEGEEKTIDSIKYIGYKANSVFSVEVKNSAEGDKYLLWVRGTEDSSFNYRSNLNDFLNGATKLTYTVEIALNGDAPPSYSYLRIRGKTSAESIIVFRVLKSGNITLGNEEKNGIVIAKVSEDFVKISITVDFEEGKLYATGADGNLCECEFSIPSGYESYKEYLASCQTYLFDWYAAKSGNENSELRIDNISIKAEF